MFWRELTAGHSSLGYYLGKVTSSFYRILVASLHFAAALTVSASPTIDFGYIYLIVLIDIFGIYGVCAIVAQVVDRRNASLFAVVTCLFLGLTSGFGLNQAKATSAGFGWLFYLSFFWWSGSILFERGVDPFSNVYQIQTAASYWGFNLNITRNGIYGILSGIGFRVVGYFILKFVTRNLK